MRFCAHVRFDRSNFPGCKNIHAIISHIPRRHKSLFLRAADCILYAQRTDYCYLGFNVNIGRHYFAPIISPRLPIRCCDSLWNAASPFHPFTRAINSDSRFFTRDPNIFSSPLFLIIPLIVNRRSQEVRGVDLARCFWAPHARLMYVYMYVCIRACVRARMRVCVYMYVCGYIEHGYTCDRVSDDEFEWLSRARFN